MSITDDYGGLESRTAAAHMREVMKSDYTQLERDIKRHMEEEAGKLFSDSFMQKWGSTATYSNIQTADLTYEALETTTKEMDSFRNLLSENLKMTPVSLIYDDEVWGVEVPEDERRYTHSTCALPITVAHPDRGMLVGDEAMEWFREEYNKAEDDNPMAALRDVLPDVYGRKEHAMRMQREAEEREARADARMDGLAQKLGAFMDQYCGDVLEYEAEDEPEKD